MPSQPWAVGLLILGVGLGAALQGVINAALSRSTGTVAAAMVSVTGTFLIGLLALVIGLGGSRTGILNILHAPVYLWTGGIFGGLVVLAGILFIPKVGAGTFIVLLVGGLLIGSMILDHVGALGLERHVMTPVRISGSLFVLLGAWLVSFR